MAKNGLQQSDGKARIAGAARTRNPKTGLWTNRDAVAGKFMDVKKSGGTLKRLRPED